MDPDLDLTLDLAPDPAVSVSTFEMATKNDF
jgi:hypothetical protein